MEEIDVDVNVERCDGDEATETEAVHSTEMLTTGENAKENSPKQKFVRLPITRVKAMMKKDPTCSLISQDAVFLVTKSTEMFIEFLANEAAKQVSSNKRKLITRKELDIAIENCSQLCFLDGALE